MLLIADRLRVRRVLLQGGGRGLMHLRVEGTLQGGDGARERESAHVFSAANVRARSLL